MQQIRVDKIEKKQLPIVSSIARNTWPDTYGKILSASQLEYMLQRFYNIDQLNSSFDNGSQFYVVFEGDDALAFLEIGLQLEDNIAKLHKIYVLPEAQGKRLGILLIEKALQVALQNNCIGLYLNVNRYNKARAFYEKMGFETIIEEDVDIGAGYYMNDYVMLYKIN